MYTVRTCALTLQVTDIYEYGWGQSFHFSPKLPGTLLTQLQAPRLRIALPVATASLRCLKAASRMRLVVRRGCVWFTDMGLLHVLQARTGSSLRQHMRHVLQWS
jgi:hypothetical protein